MVFWSPCPTWQALLPRSWLAPFWELPARLSSLHSQVQLHDQKLTFPKKSPAFCTVSIYHISIWCSAPLMCAATWQCILQWLHQQTVLWNCSFSRYLFCNKSAVWRPFKGWKSAPLFPLLAVLRTTFAWCRLIRHWASIAIFPDPWTAVKQRHIFLYKLPYELLIIAVPWLVPIQACSTCWLLCTVCSCQSLQGLYICIYSTNSILLTYITSHRHVWFWYTLICFVSVDAYIANTPEYFCLSLW